MRVRYSLLYFVTRSYVSHLYHEKKSQVVGLIVYSYGTPSRASRLHTRSMARTCSLPPTSPSNPLLLLSSKDHIYPFHLLSRPLKITDSINNSTSELSHPLASYHPNRCWCYVKQTPFTSSTCTLVPSKLERPHLQAPTPMLPSFLPNFCCC